MYSPVKCTTDVEAVDHEIHRPEHKNSGAYSTDKPLKLARSFASAQSHVRIQKKSVSGGRGPDNAYLVTRAVRTSSRVVQLLLEVQLPLEGDPYQYFLENL